MRMYQLIYVEMSAFCLIILFYIFIRMRKADGRQSRAVAFDRVIFSVAFIFLLDMSWVLLDGIDSPAAAAANAAVNALYMTMTGVVGLCWFLYVRVRLGYPTLSRGKTALCSLPLILLAALCCSSPWTKLIFYIDVGNVYTRGQLFWIQLILSYSYLIGASVLVFVKMSRERNVYRQGEYATLLSFFFFPCLGGIITTMFFGIPAMWPLATLSLLMVFVDLQSYQISTDALTGLNNRRQFDRYIRDVIPPTKKHESVYLLMMDINSFKYINDTFGHVEGDNALAETAAILRRVCNKRDAFLARYGGDEFAILLYADSPEAAEALKRELTAQFCARNDGSATEYKLSLSIGIASYDGGSTVQSFIAKADGELYREKQAYKLGRP